MITYDDVIRLSKEMDRLREENKNLDETCNEVIREYEKVSAENKFLRQRNKELRQKTWYGVYEENLKLTEELNHYKGMVKAIEEFIKNNSIKE